MDLQRERFSARPLTTDQMIALVPGITQSGLQPCSGTPPQPPPVEEMALAGGGPSPTIPPSAPGVEVVVRGVEGEGSGRVGGGGAAEPCAEGQSAPRLGRRAEVGPQPYSGILINGGLALHPHRYLECGLTYFPHLWGVGSYVPCLT